MKDAMLSSMSVPRLTRGSAAMRAFPRHEKAVVVTSAFQSVGKPKADVSGSALSVPRRRTNVVRGVRGGTRLASRPSSRHRESAAGL
jgi:hypothetical protein